MKSEDSSPSNDFKITNQNNYILSGLDKNKNISKIPSNDIGEKNITDKQEGDEQNDSINFNISFFLPKDIYKNIAGDEENTDNNNNGNIINNNNLNLNQNDDNSSYNLKESNDFESSKKNDINDKNLNLNQNNIAGFGNIFQNTIDNNEDSNQEFNNNISKIERRDFGTRDNFNQDNNSFSATNNNNNDNNFPMNNSNNTSINLQYGNNNIINDNFCSPNNSNLMNHPQATNNRQLFSHQNNLINQNITNNYLINNNEIPGFLYQNQFQNISPQLFQINENKNNNKTKKKKVFDEYITEMFGRRGWICDLCNNFNYETRKKCNRCHMMKKPKKIAEYYQAKMNKFLVNKNYWICKYCGNYNFPFRLACNRCQAKK